MEWEKELISFFQHPEVISYESDELVELEKEVLMEIGNILIGACMGKIFELLESDIIYLPPQTMLGEQMRDSFTISGLRGEDIAIVMKTGFTVSRIER